MVALHPIKALSFSRALRLCLPLLMVACSKEIKNDRINDVSSKNVSTCIDSISIVPTLGIGADMLKYHIKTNDSALIGMFKNVHEDRGVRVYLSGTDYVENVDHRYAIMLSKVSDTLYVIEYPTSIAFDLPSYLYQKLIDSVLADPIITIVDSSDNEYRIGRCLDAPDC